MTPQRPFPDPLGRPHRRTKQEKIAADLTRFGGGTITTSVPVHSDQELYDMIFDRLDYLLGFVPRLQSIENYLMNDAVDDGTAYGTGSVTPYPYGTALVQPGLAWPVWYIHEYVRGVRDGQDKDYLEIEFLNSGRAAVFTGTPEAVQALARSINLVLKESA